MKLVIGKELPKQYLDEIRESIPDAEIISVSSREEQNRELQDADILFTRILPDTVDHAKKLRWVQFMWEGIDDISDEFRKSEIILTNAGGVHSLQIAEHVFLYLLNLCRRNRLYEKYQLNREWLGWFDQPPLRRLFGTTIGIIGYGRIGRAVANIAKGFNMKVIAVKKNPEIRHHDDHLGGSCCDREGILPDIILGMEDLDILLENSDHVIMTLPLTSETRDLFGEMEFKKMRKTSFFVNIGRGKVVDEKALIDALRNGEISGAGLDVFETEPLPSSSPLWEMENVIITPHSSVGGDPADEDVVNIFLENLKRFQNNQRMINVIDKMRGY